MNFKEWRVARLVDRIEVLNAELQSVKGLVEQASAMLPGHWTKRSEDLQAEISWNEECLKQLQTP